MKRSRKLSWTLVILTIWLVMFAWGVSYGADVTLSWEAPVPVDSRITGYDIYVSTLEPPLTEADCIGSTTETSLEITNLPTATGHYFGAKSHDAEGNQSVMSDYIHYTTEADIGPPVIIEIPGRIKPPFGLWLIFSWF